MPIAPRPIIDTLAGLVARAHATLTGIGADDHHAQSHAAAHATGQVDALSAAAIGASATAHTHTHAATTGQGTDDHHAKSHAHSGADGSGSVAYSALTSIPATFAPTAHAAAHAGGGADALALAGLARPMRVGWYLGPPCAASVAAKTNGQMACQPLILTQAQTLDQLIIETTVAASVGGVTRLGIYAGDANGQPGALVLDAGTLDATVTAAILVKPINQALAAGVYWLAAVTQGGPGTTPTYRTNSGGLPGCQGEAAATSMTTTACNGYAQNGVTGALPNPAVVIAGMGTSIRIVVHFSA